MNFWHFLDRQFRAGGPILFLLFVVLLVAATDGGKHGCSLRVGYSDGELRVGEPVDGGAR